MTCTRTRRLGHLLVHQRAADPGDHAGAWQEVHLRGGGGQRP